MRRIGCITTWLLLAGSLAFVGLTTGCETGERRPSAQSSSVAPTSQPTDVMARSDSERAQADLERQRREGMPERRPYDPGGGRPVDQPHVGGRR